MEAPNPISMTTPGLIINELDNKISDSKIGDKPKINNNNNTSLIKRTEYKLEYKNKIFIISLSMTSDKQYINIQSKEEGNITYYFESQMKMEELMKFDKIFRTCDDIEEALASFILFIASFFVPLTFGRNYFRSDKQIKVLFYLHYHSLIRTFDPKI